MIKNKRDYRSYILADAKAMGINYNSFKARFVAYHTNPRWKFIKKLRRVELFKNIRKNLFLKLYYLYLWQDYKKCALKLGFSIPPNVVDKGLSLPHYGTIVISKDAKIGKNCRIHICVNIGASGGTKDAPIIGDNIYIGPGAKLFGKIEISDNCYIAANAVVNKSFSEEGSVIGGIPAKILKMEKNVWWEKNRLDLKASL